MKDQQEQNQQQQRQLQQALLHTQQPALTTTTTALQYQTYEQTLQLHKNETNYNQSSLTPTLSIQQHQQETATYLQQVFERQSNATTYLQQSNLQTVLNNQLNQHIKQSSTQLQPTLPSNYKQENHQQQFQPTNKSITSIKTSNLFKKKKTPAINCFATFNNNMSSTTMTTRNFHLTNTYNNHNQYTQQMQQNFIFPNVASNMAYQTQNYNDNNISMNMNMNNQLQVYQQNLQQQMHIQMQEQQQQLQYQLMQQQIKQKHEQQSHQLDMSVEIQQQQQQTIQYNIQQQQQQQQQYNRNIIRKEQELLQTADCNNVALVVENVDRNSNEIKTCLKTSNPTTPTSDKFIMDAKEIENFLAKELFTQQLLSVDGIQSGVPTITTPTLTPTTLRSIEETMVELTSEPLNAPFQAGFIPPPICGDIGRFQGTTVETTPITYNDSHLSNYNDYSDSDVSSQSSDANHNNEDNSLATDTSSAATDSASFQNGSIGLNNTHATSTTASSLNAFTEANVAIVAESEKILHDNYMNRMPNHHNNNTSNSATRNNGSSGTMRRNQGGRRPNKQTNMSPEEEEKRRVRRERNKLAAARCRKRRVDQTNELLGEVDILERKRCDYQKIIEELNEEKKNLKRILEIHRPTCNKNNNNILNNVTTATLNGLINNSNDSNSTITGLDTTLASTGRCDSPLDLKPMFIKNEPADIIDSNSSLDHDDDAITVAVGGAGGCGGVGDISSPKRALINCNNPMIPPLPNIASFATSLVSSPTLNTPVVTMAPTSFASLIASSSSSNNNNNINSKPRPNSLNVSARAASNINGVAIQTPSTGIGGLNYDSLMDGGTGLTPVSGPLAPTILPNGHRHAFEMSTPTTESTLTNLVSF